MTPRADEPLARTVVTLEEPQDGVLVAVLPTADHVDRASNGAVVLADRSLLPELVPSLVAGPSLQERRRLFHAFEPHGPPGVADYLGIGRSGVVAEHDRRPPEHVFAVEGAPDVVDVVGVPVVGRAHAHDPA